MNKKRVLLGMSGGTDSSVAAMRLLEAGFEVTGVTFRFYEPEGSVEYLNDARELASGLGIEHIIFDARKQFSETVVSYFIDSYMKGETPVPCTLCNNLLKWPLLLKLADEKGIYYISTGHYVNKKRIGNKFFLSGARDTDKDQSFFLWGLSQDILSRAMFPMGNIYKTDAREYAADKGYCRVASKKDSIGVCFCPRDYRSFLRRHVSPELLKKGVFVDENGKYLGESEGYPFYTIGQRRGLGVYLNRAVFVKDIIVSENKIVLAPLKLLEKSSMILKDWVLIDEDMVLDRNDIIVKIRYRKQANRCTVSKRGDGCLAVELHEPLTAISAGQAAAFYKDSLLLGGGIIV